MTIKQIKEIINDWQFVENPTEEKEPFFWRWKDDELDLMAGYIFNLLKNQDIQSRRDELNRLKTKKVKGAKLVDLKLIDERLKALEEEVK